VRAATFKVDGMRPFTLNGERKLVPHARAALVRQWREAFGWEAKVARVEQFGAVDVVVTPYLHTMVRQDTGGCIPAAKAAIDGLVDVGVLPSDGPDVVRSLKFLAPIHGEGNGLVLELTEVPA
jgi:hypothetical protein